MADSSENNKACIIYYIREGFYSRARKIALRNNDGDSVLLFYAGTAHILEGQYPEGMRILHSLQDDPEVMLGAVLALIYAQRCCKSLDREELSKLESKLKEERRKARDRALYYAGMFLFLTQRYEKSREYVDRMLKINTASEGLVLKGWLEMQSSKESKDAKLKNVLEFFDTALGEGKNLDALLGKVKYFELRNNFSGALELLNQAVVTFVGEIPPLIEKMKLQLALQDWEQTIDIGKRIVLSDSHNIEAKRHMVLYNLCVFRDIEMALKMISDLEDEFQNTEPTNGHLLCETAQLFSRTCVGQVEVLKCCQILAEKAVAINGENADFVTEVAKQLALQGKMKEAVQHYKTATKLDESSIKAMTGIIFCQLVEGHTDVAEQQLEFLKEIQKAVGVSANILFLSAMLIRKKGGNALDVLGYLGECVKAHFASLAGIPLGLKYYLNLDPDFLILVVKEYLHYAPSQPLSPGQPIPALLYQAMLVLEPLTKSCSGLWEPFYYMANIKYLIGDVKTAGNLLQHILQKLSPSSTECYLLLAKIQLHEGNFAKANQSLEMAVSCNFDIRDSPVYNLVRAQVQKRKGELDEAIKSLQTVMSLAKISPSRSRSARKSQTMNLTNTDKVRLYLELAETYQLLKQPHEATKVMQDAMMEFQGTAEEACIVIANADLALSKGESEQSLVMLRNIKPDQPYYLQAREKMAYIYLHHRRDKRLFANCYREVLDKSPSLQAFLMLGDAYISIQEPELAIEVYEQALKINPRDSNLARKIGEALVKTHNYNKAINYYKEALKNESQSFLRYDLAELLMKMKQYEKAEKLLNQAISSTEGNDLSSLMNEVKNFLLLSKIYQKSGNVTGHIYSLTKAKDAQVRVLKRCQVEQPDNVETQQQLTSSICRQMAEHTALQKNFEGAIKLYKEALLHDENDNQAMIDLAKLFIMIGDLESCQNVCSTLLANQSENEIANVMMADVMFRKNDYETALYHFKQVLDRKPDSYEALARFVEVMRRVGKLDEVADFFTKAEKRSPRMLTEPGYSFCKGLYEWYTGGSNSAVKLFNKARRDGVWGQRAIYNMIEICLNPNNDMLGGETFETVDVDGSSHDKHDFKDVALRTADKLIKELQPNAGEIHQVVLRSFLLLSTKQKTDADKALNEFLQLANNELYRDNLLLILGMSTAYMILKQTPRARNQLKRIAKNSWNFEDAEYLERCWLLLADIYIQSGKYDMGAELLKRVLEHNKSSCKAYEYMGYIMEKENSYKDASTNYEMAWKYGGQNNPAIGYKLAFNYMKAKRYAAAIDVCHLVLEKFPNYPKIRKDILEKSRGNLRA